MKRRALGKGLRSLIPEAPPPADAGPARVAAAKLPEIDIDRIKPNREQPRQAFDQESLEELARSMKAQGVLQPVVVRHAADGLYELIAGERRWRAAQIAGLLKLPAVVREVTDDRLLELALIENLQREELNPLEEAAAYQTLMDDLGLTQQEVAERVGKNRSTVANAVRLLNLPLEIQARIRTGEVSAGHAKALAAWTDAAAQIALAERIARDGLSVRAVERLVERQRRARRPRTTSPGKRDPNVVAAEESLQRALGTRVRIVQGKTGAGRLELHFFNDEELQRLYQAVMQSARGG